LIQSSWSSRVHFTLEIGLSDCTLKNEMFLLITENDVVDIVNLVPKVKLCCKDRSCILCLAIDIEVDIHPDKVVESHSALGEDDYSSLSVCYLTPQNLPMCNKVEFTVSHAALSHHNKEQISMVITEPEGVSFGSQVLLYSPKASLNKEVFVPSLVEVCSLELKEFIEDCHVPIFRHKVDQELKQVELHFSDSNTSLPSMCIQNESNGKCKPWNWLTIPLYSVTSCTCIEVWDEHDQMSVRAKKCPFKHQGEKNVWENLSVSVHQGQMNDNGLMLLWNLSAPCRLEGVVWACERTGGPKLSSCREIKGFRQNFTRENWIQNERGLWGKIGVFEQIDLQKCPCMMVKVKGMNHELGPVCYRNTDRWRWSLFAVAVIFLICLTILIFYLLRNFVKRWVWSCRHGGFVKIGKKGCVLLLSPPDADGAASALVCGLGSLLCNQGFSVTVDQWSRKGQWTSGPLQWYYSQMLNMNSQGDRVVLVLTPKSLERAEEWTDKHNKAIKLEDRSLPQTVSPYSDVFTASLLDIKACKNRGIASERFLLVKLDCHWSQPPSRDRRLPELLQGLPLFQFPSQADALLSELTVGRTVNGQNRKMWSQWKQPHSVVSGGKAKEGAVQQKTLHSKYFAGEKILEAEPFKLV
uniref:Interleukin-17 receptor C-like n=1 Tax=Sphaeramia orbicularis TaxID=375764 RepID=A0A672YBY8_9TELE